MIKQIQLRGISRTPSDKMSGDGGLSESLNMYMDTAENAPVFVPEDVTAKLKLPADLQVERIFIHKTANYENFIVVQSDRVVAYTPDVVDDEPIAVMPLKEGETIIDITSVGNTLILSTASDIYYVLYQDRAYSLLGNKVPFPLVDFEARYEGDKQVRSFFDPLLDRDLLSFDAEHLVDEWNNNITNSGEHKNEKVTSQLKDFWERYDDLYQRVTTEDDTFTSPVFVRYAIKMYDGSLLSSMPILINPLGADLHINAEYIEGYRPGQYDELEHFTESFFNVLVPSFKIHAKLVNQDALSQWKDLYDSINVYITRPYKDYINRNASTISDIEQREVLITDSYTSITANVHLTKLSKDALLLQSSQARCVKEIHFLDDTKNITEDFKELAEGFEFGPSIIPEGGLDTQDLLDEDDMKHYIQTSGNLDVYNNQLLLINPSQIIDYDYNRLNAYDIVEHESSGKPVTTITYDVTYILKGYTEDKVVKKQFSYVYSVFADERIYAFQIFPDSRAYKMIVKATIKTSGAQGTTEIKYGEFDMYPHPYLDCAYYYGGVENELVSLCTQDSATDHPINAVDDLENKLLVSKMDDPFVFPLTGRFTFQSKVLGVGVATTALSQGQFGQFPLYVFTEDGIWAMETAADGSFITQRPLSREVCINPDSICSIDNAVVFTTEKAVMMISGSQVMNISPYMNGKHFIPNDSAVNLISKQDGFAEFESVIKDDDPFMKFMRDAKTAYDYTGQRLIFISPSNKDFQYVYKIDTQTWHKVAFEGLNLRKPINSFPECYVLGDDSQESVIKSAEILGMSVEEMRDSIQRNDGAVYCRLDNPDEVDLIAGRLYLLDVDWVYNGYDEGYEYLVAITGVKNKAVPAWVQGVMNISNTKFQSLIEGNAFGEYNILVTKEEDDEGSLFYDENYGLAAFFELTVIKREECYKARFDNYKLGQITSKVFSLNTILDASIAQPTAKGILITRPFDLGMPDIYKSITSIKIRGDYDTGNVKYILQGSDDGRNFNTLSSLRGKSWKMFRIFILADLEPTERISWIDIDFEPRYQNKLR